LYPNILIVAASYLLGSIPFGYLLVRIFRGEDVRRSGSGNIGATNVSRKSPVLGVVTLVLDALKGVAAVMVAVVFYNNTNRSLSMTALMSLAALCAIVGHMFPIWLKFRGGKGVATGLGSFAMIAPVAVLACAVIFLVVALISRYVSLASIVSVALFPSMVWTLHQYGHSLLALVFMTIASLLIVVKHRQNIHRLLTGTEHRFGSKHA
jgi:acyl phosphate:glycerol-3-phosphate acyltransferase